MDIGENFVRGNLFEPWYYLLLMLYLTILTVPSLVISKPWRSQSGRRDVSNVHTIALGDCRAALAMTGLGQQQTAKAKIVIDSESIQMTRALKLFFLLVTVLFMVGCQSAPKMNYAKLPPPPRDGVTQPEFEAPGEPGILAFSDRLYFMLDTELKWKVGETQKKIVSPPGFVSDGASIPKVFWPLGLVPYGAHGRATAVHDYMYWSQQCSRKQADNIMLIALKESGVSIFTQWILMAGVRLFGRLAWNENARDRENDFSRLISLESAGKFMDQFTIWKPKYPYPKGSTAEPFPAPIPFTWKEYQSFLKQEGARDPKFPAPDYCHCGDSRKIPQGNDSECR